MKIGISGWFEALEKELQETFTGSEPDLEASEYKGFVITTKSGQLIFRLAKVTPKKVGQFVTLWKRNNDKITQPFDFTEPYTHYIIAIEEEQKRGYFLFSKQVLLEKGILSSTIKEGKRGFRIYPPWSETSNAQAKKTQAWQINYFKLLNE